MGESELCVKTSGWNGYVRLVKTEPKQRRVHAFGLSPGDAGPLQQESLKEISNIPNLTILGIPYSASTFYRSFVYKAPLSLCMILIFLYC